jgi:hypothetical protein
MTREAREEGLLRDFAPRNDEKRGGRNDKGVEGEDTGGSQVKSFLITSARLSPFILTKVLSISYISVYNVDNRHCE